MSTIGDIEDALIARIQASAIAAKVRAVDSLPAAWDQTTLKRALRTLPAVYVSFLGARPRQGGAHAEVVETTWAVYAVTGHASGQAARRRGDSREIGAYELLDTLVPWLRGHTLANIGTLALVEVGNLFSEGSDLDGVSLYSATFRLPAAFATLPDPATLDAFITFHADYDVGETADTPEPGDTVTLEQ